MPTPATCQDCRHLVPQGQTHGLCTIRPPHWLGAILPPAKRQVALNAPGCSLGQPKAKAKLGRPPVGSQLSPREAQLLALLRTPEGPRLSHQGLTDVLGLSNPAQVSQLMRALERKGWITWTRARPGKLRHIEVHPEPRPQSQAHESCQTEPCHDSL